MKDPASALGEQVANRLLKDEEWAREKLRAKAGRSFLVRSGPVAWVIMQAKARRRSPACAGSIQPMNQAELNDFDLSISAVPVLP